MSLFKRHKHNWSPGKVHEVTRNNGRVSFIDTVQVRQCQDETCLLRQTRLM